MNTSLERQFANLQAEKDAIKRAKIIYYLHHDREVTLKEISTHLQVHSSYISHYLRLLQLPSIVLDGYYAKQVSSAHLFILSRLKKEEDIINAYRTILSNNLTSAQTEELIREIKFTVSTTEKSLSKNEKDEIIEDLEKEFPGIEVHITQSRVKGKIVLELKGETEKTSEFLHTVKKRLTKRSYSEFYDDTLQVLE